MGEAGFTPLTAMSAEGARVGFSACEKCGAAILIQPRERVDPLAVHRRWHEELEAMIRAALNEKGKLDG